MLVSMALTAKARHNGLLFLLLLLVITLVLSSTASSSHVHMSASRWLMELPVTPLAQSRACLPVMYSYISCMAIPETSCTILCSTQHTPILALDACCNGIMLAQPTMTCKQHMQTVYPPASMSCWQCASARCCLKADKPAHSGN